MGAGHAFSCSQADRRGGEVLAKTVAGLSAERNVDDRTVEYDDFGPKRRRYGAVETATNKHQRRQYVDALDAQLNTGDW